MNERKQSSSAYPYQFFMASSTDHVTGVTGATVTMQLSKNGAAFAPAAGAVSELGFGWYSLAGVAADRATLGGCALHASAPGCDPFDGKLNIVPWDPFDPNLSLAALPSAAAGTAGGLPTVDASNAVKLQSGTGPNQLNLNGGGVSVFANGDKTGYALTQSFPANFANLAVSAGGAVTAGTVADKTGYGLAAPAPTAAQVAAAVWTDTAAADFAVAGSPGKALLTNLDANVASRLAASTYAAPPTVNAIAGAILATPANLLQTDATGRVAAGNLPADYQQRGVAVTLPTTAPAGYGGTAAPTAAQVAAAVWTDTAAADFAVAGSPGKALLTNLDANVASRSTFAGGPVASVTGNVGGNVVGSVGSLAGVSFPANFAGLAIGAGGVVTAGTVADKSGYKLAADGVDAVVVETGVNARQAMSAVLSSSVGVLSGAATPSITIQGGNVAATRIRATVDPSGNRTSVTLSLPA